MLMQLKIYHIKKLKRVCCKIIFNEHRNEYLILKNNSNCAAVDLPFPDNRVERMSCDT